MSEQLKALSEVQEQPGKTEAPPMYGCTCVYMFAYRVASSPGKPGFLSTAFSTFYIFRTFLRS